ncbi:MAG: NAD(P)-binding domain-containing protein [Bryobacterales bacterium]|nr:NAD(P)-binding domain-containing protein [Bryobacterales bacterium]
MMQRIREGFRAVLQSSDMDSRRPLVDEHLESSLPGLFVIGDLAGAPVVKLAMEHGYRVGNRIASLSDSRATLPGAVDVLVVGSGAAGLNAALTLREHGLRILILEKSRVANTIEDFPEGKWVYAEPDSVPAKGKLWLQGSTKEDLLARWHETIRSNALELHTDEGVEAIERRTDLHFDVKTAKASYIARRVVLAIGSRGNPRWLHVPGEEDERVYHRLYSPQNYREAQVLVVGGGNSAIEAALALAPQNQVTLSYRGEALARVFKENRRQFEEAVAAGRVEAVFRSNVKSFGQGRYQLEIEDGDGRKKAEEREYDHAFVLVGADAPTAFLRKLGVKLENEWTGSLWLSAALSLLALVGLWALGGQSGIAALDGLGYAGAALALTATGTLAYQGWRGSRFAWLGVAFLVAYTIYGAKMGTGHEFWPYRGWGYRALSLFERPWAFWYTVLYTAVMTVFGIQAIKRWGFDRKDRFQIWRYVSLLSFQWLFFFLVPEFLFQMAVKYQWVGEAIANDPTFADQAWRSYGIVYAWPLFFYTFFGSPHQIWMVWGAVLSFGIIPLLVLFHGKRYCSWICGCGGLAETLGDRWRHLAPKGKPALRWERMNLVVLVVAAALTLLMVGRDAVYFFRQPAALGVEWYRLIADVWLVGIVPVTLYPFFGGKIWCRYWCPLASMMQVFSGWFTRTKWSRFAIRANDKCISCGECTRYCQVGIDVMRFAQLQNELNNANSSCIGCGICVTVCPMDVLSFGGEATVKLVQIENTKAV